MVNELSQIENYVEHFHLSDAGGEDGEGLQFGDGDLPFGEVIPILNKHKEKSFAIEVWKGHEHSGKGFGVFLDRVSKAGLLIS